MDTTVYNEPWKAEIYSLIEQARAQGLWLWCRYQDLWFSPGELADAHRNGRFMWSAENWRLRHPSEQLAAANRKVQEALAARDAIAAHIP